MRLLPILFLLALTPSAVAQAERQTTYVYPPWKHCLGMHRVGSLELKLFLGPRAAFANPQGLAAVKLAQLDDPKTGADDDILTVYGVNSDRGEIAYNLSLTEVRLFGRTGSGEGEFRQPRGIAANTDGLVVVADTGNRRLSLLQYGEEGLSHSKHVTLPGERFLPTDVHIADDMIWATDYEGNRILRFSLEGDYLDQWAAQGLEHPLGLSVQSPADDWNYRKRFTLVVVDREGQRVSSYGPNGQLIHRREANEILPPPACLTYPVLDLHGQVILPDSIQGRLVKMNRKLDHLVTVDRLDGDSRPLSHPTGIAIWRRFGQLFLAEDSGGAYVWTGTDILDARLESVSSRKGRRSIKVDFRLTEPSLVSYDLLVGGKKRELRTQRRRRAGRVSDRLMLPPDLTEDATLLLSAKPTYSARKILTVTRELPLAAQKQGAR